MAFVKLNNLNSSFRNLLKFSPKDFHFAKYSSNQTWEPKQIETHTHQKWDKDDYRNARFIDKPKHVNTNWGIKLIEEVPPKECKESVVSCDGGDGPLGHPKVYINLDKPGNHACGYCGLRFFKSNKH